MRCSIVLSGLLLLSLAEANAQLKTMVPFYTAYRTTQDGKVVDIGSSTRKDLIVLSDTSKRVRFYVHNSKTGELNIALNALSLTTAKQLTLEVKSKKMNVTIPVLNTAKEIKIGTVQLSDTGFVELVFSSKKPLPGILGLGNLLLSGTASEGLRFNARHDLAVYPCCVSLYHMPAPME